MFKTENNGVNVVDMTANSNAEMRELDLNEVESVNGGLVLLIIGGILLLGACAGAAYLGYQAGKSATD